MGTRRFAEDSITVVDGVGGGEWSATTTSDLIEMLGAIARATESSKVEVGDAGATPESRAQGPTASEEQAVHPEMPQGMVGRSVHPLSPQGVPLAMEEEDKVKEIEREGSQSQTAASSISEGRKLWSWKRRTPLGR